MDDEEEVRGNNKFKVRNVSFETYFSPFIYATKIVVNDDLSVLSLNSLISES